MRVVIIIQARMGSTRLPGKVLAPVMGRPLLDYQIERLRRSAREVDIVVATTTQPRDQQIVDYCKAHRVDYYRGSEDDVLERYWKAAKDYADTVVRISSDSPLIDPQIVDQVIALYGDSYPAYDYVSNTLTRTYPRGMDVEVFSFKSLEEAFTYATLPHEREHVTPYIYTHSDRFKLGTVTSNSNNSHYRLTVDTAEDLTLVTRVIETLYPRSPNFGLQEIVTLFAADPSLPQINAAIQQKTM